MVKINGIDFKIYELDTLDSIIRRIAAKMNTIPKYLYFENGIPNLDEFKSDDNIIVEDFLDYIKTNSSGLDFAEFFSTVENYVEQLELDLMEDIFIYFILFNESLLSTPTEYLGPLFLQIKIESQKYFTEKLNIEDIWNDKKVLKNNLDLRIKNNKNSVVEDEKYFKTIETAKKIEATSFEPESVKVRMTLNVNKLSILEFFNEIQLNEEAPLATINHMYKIYKNFIPPADWSVYLNAYSDLFPNNLILNVNTYKNEYIEAIFMEQGEYIILEADLDINKTKKLVDKLTSIISDVVPNITLDIIEIQQINLKGFYYYPQSTFNVYTLADTVMNNPLFSNLMVIDEHDKASKDKTSVYIRFQNPSIGKITATLTAKIVESSDPILRGKDRKLFKTGDYYIRVKIAYSDNIQAVEEFQRFFGKLLDIYIKLEPQLMALYKMFGIVLNKILPSKPTDTSKQTLKQIAPKMFISQYSSKCNFKPNVIDDDKIDQEKQKGNIVMTYPLPEDETEDFPVLNYVCRDKKAPFPGLIKNVLSNKDEIPYLPCCFKVDQSTKVSSAYTAYFDPDNYVVDDDKKQQGTIITKKLVNFNNYGTLTKNLEDIFNLFDNNSNHLYLRKGMSSNNDSFLEAVLECVHYDKVSKIPKNKRDVMLKQVRNKLSDFEYLPSAKQEMYDFSLDQILEYLESDKDFSSDYFINLLQTYFNCNIFIFSRRKNSEDTILSVPRHLQAYYKRKHSDRCIFIYKHYGAVSDHRSKPKYEIIIRRKKTTKQEQFIFDINTDIGKSINQIFQNLTLAYALNTKIHTNFFPEHLSEPVVQDIDSYGKTRYLTFIVDELDSPITIKTSPLQPFSIPSDIYLKHEKTYSENAITFLTTYGDGTITQNVFNDRVVSYSGIIGNIEIEIQTNEDAVSAKYERKNIVKVDDLDTSSILESYKFYKKLSRIIVSYSNWLYSKYLHERDEKVSEESLQDFVQNNIDIIEDYTYPPFFKEFTMDNGVMLDNKLIVKSEETLKRLIYSLQLTSRNRHLIYNYYKRKYIDNFFEDISDFDPHHFQVLLQGANSIQLWRSEYESSHYLHNTVVLNHTTPYFFKNDLVSPDLHLAINIDEMSKGFTINEYWNKFGFVYENGVPIIEYNYTLFAIRNSSNIEKYTIGKPNNKSPVILGYKVNDKPKFTLLLKL